MNKLVFIDNNRLVTDSLIIAETFGKRHDNVLQDINNLECSQEFSLLNFQESTYKNERGREYPKFLITQDGFTFLVMGYTGKDAAHFKEMYINEFNRMREQLHVPPYAALSKEMQAIFMLDKRSQEVELRVERLENNTTIDYGQQRQLQSLASKRVISIIGGKESPAYENKSLRGEAYSSIWRDYKGYFNVNSYHNTLVKDFEKAKDYVNRWQAQGQLLREVEEANKQISM